MAVKMVFLAVVIFAVITTVKGSESKHKGELEVFCICRVTKSFHPYKHWPKDLHVHNPTVSEKYAKHRCR